MSITKIQKVKSLKKIVAYATQSHKTNSDLITTYKCNVNSIERDFEDTLLDYHSRKKKIHKELSSRMIIQSFDKHDNVTPKEAHQYGLEFAENYLKGKHQFLLVTHTETDNIHNHIIFNDISFDDLKHFDSKRENSLNRLRFENDKVSEKYNLNIIEKGRKNNKYLAYQEYAVRVKGKSFKSQLEDAIDKNIEFATDYKDFLRLMKEDGYDSKQGKYLAFQNPKSSKYMRTKTLGINYLESSIKYRIENKEYQPIKSNIIEKEWIDKTTEKFKNNKGLERWATIQNINYLNEINAYIYKEKVSLEEYSQIKTGAKELFKILGEELNKLDKDIYSLEKMAGTFKGYEECHVVMSHYKSIKDKDQRAAYKKENYKTFKIFDSIKKNINKLKVEYGINDEAELQNKLSAFKIDRNLMYESLNANNKERLQELIEQKTSFQERHEMESDIKNLVSSFEKEINKLDKDIATLEKLAGTFEEYKGFYDTMVSYKSMEDKEQKAEFKKDNLSLFKEYDVVLNKIETLKDVYDIKDEAELQYKLSIFKTDRNLMEESLNTNIKERTKELEEQQKKKEQEL